MIPLAVQWWSVWYPGSEPGGGGYVAQRMLAAKSEGHAQGATLLFNVAHYALRPWPWILVALRLAHRVPRSRVAAGGLSERRSAGHARRPRLSGDADLPPRGPPRPGGRLARRGVHVDDLDPPQLGLVVPGARRLPPLRAARRRARTELVRVGRIATVVLDGGGRGRLAAARERAPGLPDPAPDRRRHRPALSPALVLVAGERRQPRSSRWRSRFWSRSSSSSCTSAHSA